MGLLEAVAFVVAATLQGALWFVGYILAGWWYVLSPSYRATKEAEWRKQREMEVLSEIVGGTTGVIGSVLLAVFVWWSIRHG